MSTYSGMKFSTKDRNNDKWTDGQCALLDSSEHDELSSVISVENDFASCTSELKLNDENISVLVIVFLIWRH